MDLEPLDVSFGALVHGIDVRTLDDSAFDELHAAWLEYALLIFPAQFFTKEEQNDFARRFGDLEFEAAPISNIRRNGEVQSDPDSDLIKSLRGNEGWHHDSTYMPIQAKGAVFSAEIIPSEGGATGWSDMRAAYEVIDPAMQEKLATLNAHHSLYYSMGRVGYLPTENEGGGYDLYGYHDLDVPLRPMIKTHPDTGQPNLLVGRHAHDIVDMDPDESEALIDSINEAAVRPEWTYHHEWEVGDAVIWDNRRLMHRGTPFDMTEPRRMWHTRIAGDAQSEAALNHQNASSESLSGDRDIDKFLPNR